MKEETKIHFNLKKGEFSNIFHTLSFYFETNKQQTIEMCLLEAWKSLSEKNPELTNIKKIKEKEER